MSSRMILVIVGLVLAACAPAGNPAHIEEGLSVELQAPADATPESIDAALAIIETRFTDLAQDIGVEFVSNDDGTVTMYVAGLTDAERAISLISARGQVSIRPVLQAHSTSPMIGVDAPNIDADTGLSIEDDISSELWLGYEDTLGEQVLRVGPSRLTGSDIQDVLPYPVGESETWAVNLTMSDEGADVFADMSGQAATYAMGDPRRQIAIVLDGEVISAPSVSPDVVPDVGITGGIAQITLGRIENARDAARDLASLIGNETLPTTFDVIEVTSPK